jgi:polygalacturonase
MNRLLNLAARVAFVLVTLPVAGTFAQASVQFSDRAFDVTQFGAKGTRIWYDTDAFQKAIDACAAAGGGTVIVPRGEYLIGPVFLKSNVRLEVQTRAQIVAATEESLFKSTDATAAYAKPGDWLALINIADARNVAIVGEGTIDGQGAVWWERWRAALRESGKRSGTNRPRLIVASRSRDLLFDGVTITNSPSFHIVVRESQDVTIRNTQIISPAHSPNTDAIDPIDSRNVLITNNLLDCGDDVVAIKSNRVDAAHPGAAVENIIVRGNTCLAGRGICIGSETVGGVKNVSVEDNSITGALFGIRIKTPRGKGGDVSGITFRNNRMKDVGTPFVFSSYYTPKPLNEAELQQQLAEEGGFVLGNQIYPGEQDPPQPVLANETPHIHDVTVDGLVATGADRVGMILGLPEQAIDKLTLRNMRIDAETGLLIRHASATAETVELNVKNGAAVINQKGGQLSP